MTKPYIFSFAHLPTIRSKFPDIGGSNVEPEFDFVVVGGGPSGCALASRLYERSGGRHSVLLLEAGPHSSANPELSNCVPRIMQTRSLHKSAYDYAYPTEKDGQYSERELTVSSGKVLGGSTCINFAIWTRGARSEYDLWAAQAGSDELSWSKMEPCFERVNSLGGPIHTRRVSASPRNHYWSRIARNSLEESGFTPLQDLDLNQGLLPFGEAAESHRTPPHVFGEIAECLDDDGTRCTADRYFDYVVDPLLQSAADLSTFEVWTNIRVDKVVLQETGADIKAVGVKTKFGTIHAKHEIILTAGAIQSPYILLMSGLGPAEHLASRGIPVVRDLPGVGRNLWEHPFVDVRAKIRPSQRRETVETFASLKTSAEHMHEWATLGTGLMSGLPYEWLAYSSLKPEVVEALKDVSLTNTDEQVLLRSTIPHVEHFIHYGHGLTPAPDAIQSSYIAVTNVLLVPRSRGFVEIPPSGLPPTAAHDDSPTHPGSQYYSSSSPNANNDGINNEITAPQYSETPRIVVNQLNDPVDQAIMLAAVRSAYDILRAPAWSEYLEQPVETPSLAELRDIIKERVTTLWHLGGTCSMTTKDLGTPDYGVVDKEFRVEGIKGLRVADTSVLPFPIVAHTQAVAYALGEKVAELISYSPESESESESESTS